MKSKIIRKIDELGRVVIPKEILTNLSLQKGDDISITAENGAIILSKVGCEKAD